jgi:DNA-binding LacI/PurR family transcriptional regulator
MKNEPIIDFYLRRCEKYCSSGGYTLLCYNFESIKKETLEHFSGKSAEGLVNICDEFTKKHLESLSKNIRLFDWSFCKGDLLREKINNSLQEF